MRREGSSDIAFFVEPHVHSISKMYNVLILVFYFDLPLLIQSACVKVKFSWTSRCSVKEAVILLRSWSTLYIAFSKCKVSWFLFFYFDLPLFTQTVCLIGFYSWSFRCSTKKAVIMLPSWSTMYIAFSKCKFSLFLFCIFISHYLPKLYV